MLLCWQSQVTHSLHSCWMRWRRRGEEVDALEEARGGASCSYGEDLTSHCCDAGVSFTFHTVYSTFPLVNSRFQQTLDLFLHRVELRGQRWCFCGVVARSVQQVSPVRTGRCVWQQGVDVTTAPRCFHSKYTVPIWSGWRIQTPPNGLNCISRLSKTAGNQSLENLLRWTVMKTSCGSTCLTAAPSLNKAQGFRAAGIQLGEQTSRNPRVDGSIPSLSSPRLSAFCSSTGKVRGNLTKTILLWRLSLADSHINIYWHYSTATSTHTRNKTSFSSHIGARYCFNADLSKKKFTNKDTQFVEAALYLKKKEKTSVIVCYTF